MIIGKYFAYPEKLGLIRAPEWQNHLEKHDRARGVFFFCEGGKRRISFSLPVLLGVFGLITDFCLGHSRTLSLGCVRLSHAVMIVIGYMCRRGSACYPLPFQVNTTRLKINAWMENVWGDTCMGLVSDWFVVVSFTWAFYFYGNKILPKSSYMHKTLTFDWHLTSNSQSHVLASKKTLW